MTSIETAAAYATSPTRLHASQYRAAEAPEPLSTRANLVLQALRGTGQYMGIFAIMQQVGGGTVMETRQALNELQDRGLLEAAPEEPQDAKPEKGQGKRQEPAQEPSTPAPAPEGEGEQPAPQEPAEGDQGKALLDRLAEPVAEYDLQSDPAVEGEPQIIRDAVIEKLEEAGGYPDVFHDLQLGDGPIFGTYATLELAVARAQEYILSKDYPWAYVAMVRASATEEGTAPGPWVRVRDPREPSVNESAQASR